jgi:phosphatidylglycerophosphatase A
LNNRPGEWKGGLAIWIATCGTAGYAPVASGTVGSIVGLGLVIGVAHLPLGSLGRAVALASLAVALFPVGVWSAGKAEQFFSRKDPGQVVIDEVVGQIVTFVAAPDFSWKWMLGGFALFRIFDIFKPPPARQMERLPAGWGIMMDDVAAGLYALLSLLAFTGIRAMWR